MSSMNEDHGNHASGGGGLEADGQPQAPAPPHAHARKLPTPKAPPIPDTGPASSAPVTKSPAELANASFSPPIADDPAQPSQHPKQGTLVAQDPDTIPESFASVTRIVDRSATPEVYLDINPRR